MRRGLHPKRRRARRRHGVSRERMARHRRRRRGAGVGGKALGSAAFRDDPGVHRRQEKVRQLRLRANLQDRVQAICGQTRALGSCAQPEPCARAGSADLSTGVLRSLGLAGDRSRGNDDEHRERKASHRQVNHQLSARKCFRCPQITLPLPRSLGKVPSRRNCCHDQSVTVARLLLCLGLAPAARA